MWKTPMDCQYNVELATHDFSYQQSLTALPPLVAVFAPA